MADATAGCGSESAIKAIDVKTGKIRWSHTFPGGEGGSLSGVLNTAGKASIPAILRQCHRVRSRERQRFCGMRDLTSNVSNGPMTYEIAGKQYIAVGAGDMLYAFTLP